LAIGLELSALAGDASVAAQNPKIAKPVLVPPKEMPPLPPAVIDNQLLIGGEDINAKKDNTRMTVEVRVNGRGPYQFLVDSRANTSVVGLRISPVPQVALGAPPLAPR